MSARLLSSSAVLETIKRAWGMSVIERGLIGLALVLSVGAAQAQDYPTRSVSVVVAAAAGGPIDVFGRLLAEQMSPILGQRVVIENVGGGGGTVGGQRVVNAAPDGYTALLGTLATHANPQLLGSKPLYNSIDDFVPVGLMAELPLLLVTRGDFPASNLKEFIAYAKANAAKMNYGSAGVGSAAHLGCLMLTTAMGVDVTHVPYKGTALAMQDLLAGRLDFLCDISTSAVSHIQAGKTKALANLATERSPALPDLPTATESGLKNVSASTWTALFLPKGASPDHAKTLSSAMNKALEAPALRERYEKLGAVIVAPQRRTPAYLEGYVKAEIEKWRGAARAGKALPN